MIEINNDILNKVLGSKGYMNPNVQKCKDGIMRIFFTHSLHTYKVYAIELDKFIGMHNNYFSRKVKYNETM